MMLIYILFFLGFVLLIYGARFLVDGASALARRLGISALVVGLTIVSFGTSAPELIINILASIQGSTDLAIGNILGSNIANILLILGITAIIYPLKVTKGTVWKEIPFALLAVVVMAIMASDRLIDGSLFSGLGRGDGFILIAFLIIFLYYVFGIRKAYNPDDESSEDKVKKISLWTSWLMVLGGLIGLGLGGKWVVDGAIAIAGSFGISEAIIGLSIVAVGTSLPELVTSVVAALKKETDIAVGNIVGSNIFNVFWILGASAIIRPLPFSPDLMRDVIIVVFSTFLLFIFMFIGKKHTLKRSQGVVFVSLYIAYLVYLFLQV